MLDVKEVGAGLTPDQIVQYEQQLLTIVGDGYWAGRIKNNTDEKDLKPIG